MAIFKKKLVGGLEHFFFSQKYWAYLIIPIDELHDFSEGFFPNHQKTSSDFGVLGGSSHLVSGL